jgi:hypothetical protein
MGHMKWGPIVSTAGKLCSHQYGASLGAHLRKGEGLYPLSINSLATEYMQAVSNRMPPNRKLPHKGKQADQARLSLLHKQTS